MSTLVCVLATCPAKSVAVVDVGDWPNYIAFCILIVTAQTPV